METSPEYHGDIIFSLRPNTVPTTVFPSSLNSRVLQWDRPAGQPLRRRLEGEHYYITSDPDPELSHRQAPKRTTIWRRITRNLGDRLVSEDVSMFKIEWSPSIRVSMRTDYMPDGICGLECHRKLQRDDRASVGSAVSTL